MHNTVVTATSKLKFTATQCLSPYA